MISSEGPRVYVVRGLIVAPPVGVFKFNILVEGFIIDILLEGIQIRYTRAPCGIVLEFSMEKKGVL